MPEAVVAMSFSKHYHPLLVMLSLIIAYAASYFSLLSFERALRRQQSWLRWFAYSVLLLSTGIWLMHFVGMVALTLEPAVPVRFLPSYMLVSWLLALIGCSVGLGLVCYWPMSRASLAVTASLLGLAVASMHYLGMRGLWLMGARMQYRPLLVLASLAIAWGGSWAVLRFLYATQRQIMPRIQLWQRLFALPMTLAISGLHYTGMAAITFVPTEATPLPASGLTHEGMMLWVSFVNLLLFGVVLLWRQQRLLRGSQALARASRALLEADNETEIIAVISRLFSGSQLSLAALHYSYNVDAQGQPEAIDIVALCDEHGQAIPFSILPEKYLLFENYPVLKLMYNPSAPLFISSDIPNDSRIRANEQAYLQQIQSQAVITMPLHSSVSRNIGAILLFWPQPQRFPQSLLDLMVRLQPIASSIVTSRRLQQELEQRIEERTHALQEQLELVSRFQALIESTSDFIGYGDLQGNLQYINPAGLALLGYEALPEQANLAKLMSEQAQRYVQQGLETTSRGHIWSGETVMRRRDGRELPVSQVFTLMRDAKGKPIGVGTIARDIRQEKQTAHKLARMQAEVSTAQRIQQLLLPSMQELQAIMPLELAGYMEAAEQVGGDYYDVLHFDDDVYIAIGDVTGHGLESGLIMLMMQMGVHSLLSSGERNPQTLLGHLGQSIYHNLLRMNLERSMTVALLHYRMQAQQGRLTLSGQHETLLLVRSHPSDLAHTLPQVDIIDTIDLGFPLGLEPDIRPFMASIDVCLEPGDGVVLYSDGITEAENMQGEQYGLERLCASVAQAWHYEAELCCQIIINQLHEHIGQQYVYDDISLVVMKQRDFEKYSAAASGKDIERTSYS